jgi:hypothetical protein
MTSIQILILMNVVSFNNIVVIAIIKDLEQDLEFASMRRSKKKYESSHKFQHLLGGSIAW